MTNILRTFLKTTFLPYFSPFILHKQQHRPLNILFSSNIPVTLQDTPAPAFQTSPRKPAPISEKYLDPILLVVAPTEETPPCRRCQSSEYKRRHLFRTERGDRAREACMCMTRLWNAGLRQNHNTDNSQQPPLSLKHTHTHIHMHTIVYKRV